MKKLFGFHLFKPMPIDIDVVRGTLCGVGIGGSVKPLSILKKSKRNWGVGPEYTILLRKGVTLNVSVKESLLSGFSVVSSDKTFSSDHLRWYLDGTRIEVLEKTTQCDLISWLGEPVDENRDNVYHYLFFHVRNCEFEIVWGGHYDGEGLSHFAVHSWVEQS